jgi:Protein of unknown function (DUF2934)
MKPKDEMAARQAKKQEMVAPGAPRVELPPVPMHEEIQQRAYEIYVERGGIQGRDVEDWLQAERELRAKYAADQSA